MKISLPEILDVLQQIWLYLFKVLMIIIAFLQPIHYIMLAVGGFIFADTLIAYFRTKKMKQKWTSRKMRMGLVPKLITYQMVVITFFLLDFALLNEFITNFVQIEYFATKIIASVMIYIELLSIDETFKVLRGKSIFSYLASMLNHLKKAKASFESVNEAKNKENADNK
jgi:hypothetical protein